MKRVWTAKSSRMKAYVQLGLLCLSLLISSLHGEEVETESSKEQAINLEEQDLHQLEIQRVRRQAVSLEKEKRENVKTMKNWPRPGRQGVLGGGEDSKPNAKLRTKRHDKSKNNKWKKQLPGKFSLLATSGASKVSQHIFRAKREQNTGGRRLLPGS